ncbi:hypothetical protein CR513_24823, partial [Mucuna pruriens]
MSPYRIVFDELRLEAYENSRIYKQKVKKFHDQQILRKDLRVGQKVLLFNSQLKLIASKLRSRWDGPFVFTNIFPYGVVQVKDEQSNNTFQVNGHQIKPFHEGPTPIIVLSLFQFPLESFPLLSQFSIKAVRTESFPALVLSRPIPEIEPSSHHPRPTPSRPGQASQPSSPLGYQRDRLDYQCILVDLILSVLASGGEQSPSTMAIVVEDGIIESRPYSAFSRAESRSLYRDHFVPVSTEGISASAKTSQHSTLRFCITLTQCPTTHQVAAQHRGQPSTNMKATSLHVTPGETKFLSAHSARGRLGNILLRRGSRVYLAETKSDRSLRDHFSPAFAESDLAIAWTRHYSAPQILHHLASHRTTIEHTDPEIELTLHRLQKIRNTVVNTSSSLDSAINSNLPSANTLVFSSNLFAEPGQMENNDRTLKELATPDVVYQPWCIQYPQLEPAQTYELKSGLIHLLPKFHGLTGEDPHKHLKEFHVAVGDIGRLHQNEGVPILPGRSSKGLAVSSASAFQHLGRYEAHIPGEVLSGIQNRVHQEGDMWDKAAYRRDFARVLGKVQQTLCHLSTPSDQ